MLKNYFRSALRSLSRSRMNATLNLAGMAIGLASSLLILLYVQSEIGFDSFHPEADSLYRVSTSERDEAGSETLERALISPAIMPTLAEHFPEIEAFARLTPVGPLLSVDNVHIAPENTFWADRSILLMWGFEWVSGTPEGALEDPFSLVLSASTATTLFGRTDIAGETVMINEETPFIVDAVFADLPEKTHLGIDAIGPVSVLNRWFGSNVDDIWDSPNYASYVRLSPNASIESLSSRLTSFFDDYGGRNAPQRASLSFQPVQDIHLHSEVISELNPQGSFATVRLLTIIALFILLIAAVNFVNLSIARLARRSREVGMRKVVGASRWQLAMQFLSEAILTTLIATCIAVLLVWIVLPQFELFLNKELEMIGFNLGSILLLLAGAVLIGSVSGVYPAIFLAGLKPTSILKSGTASVGSRSRLRSALVVAQFSIAAGLMFATVIVFNQLRFMQNLDPGHAVEDVIIMPGVYSLAEDFEPFRKRLIQHPDVIDVTHAFRPPLRPLVVASDATAEVDGQLERIQIFPMWGDVHYVDTYGLSIVAGRNFNIEMDSDLDSGFLLNETAVARFGFASNEEATGSVVNYGGRDGTVLGVVKDYHQESLHSEIAPMILFPRPDNYRSIGVRFRTTNISGLVSFLREQWQPHEGNYPYDPDFLDDRFEAVYASERRLASLFGLFAGLGVLVACLGMFGIASASLERRTKEIGVRKVVGASTSNLVGKLTGEFARLTAVACLLGSVISWVFMARWMDGFAYSVGIGLWPVVIVFAISLTATAMAVSRQSYAAASRNPVDSLRCE